MDIYKRLTQRECGYDFWKNRPYFDSWKNRPYFCAMGRVRRAGRKRLFHRRLARHRLRMQDRMNGLVAEPALPP
jgi:hypothetical protein